MPLTVNDRLEILDLIARYNHAIDVDDGEAWADTFAEDAEFAGSYGPPIKGRAALLEFGGNGIARRGRVRHWTNSPVIEGDGDTATIRQYLLLLLLTEEGTKLGHTGVYHDELRRIDDAWKFVRRTVTGDMPPAW